MEIKMEEEWKHFGDKYKISNTGKVFSLIRKRLLKPQPDKDGYLLISMYGKKRKLHRIVAELFVENNKNKPIVNHKNGIKDDNNYLNLEWCTSSENSKHSFHVLKNRKFLDRIISDETRQKKSIASKKYWANHEVANSKKVLCVETNKTYPSARKASMEVCKSKTSNVVARCCSGELKTAGGYHWVYI